MYEDIDRMNVDELTKEISKMEAFLEKCETKKAITIYSFSIIGSKERQALNSQSNKL